MSSIGSVGSSNSMMMMRNMQRPSATEMADKLFDKLDTSGQGYIQKSDLENAFSQVSSSSGSTSTSDVDQLFSQLDTDSDGKVTKQEFEDVLSQLNQQFDSARMQGGMQGGGGMQGMQGGGMPPPPPPENDSGFTKDELTSQLQEIGSSDSKRASLISEVVQNFSAADADGNGKVTFKEAMAYDQSVNGTSSSSSSSSTSSSSNSSSSSSSTSSTSSNSTTSATDTSSDLKMMLQIMRLMQAYNLGPDSNTTSQLSVTA